jgi:hypothetical protein
MPDDSVPRPRALEAYIKNLHALVDVEQLQRLLSTSKDQADAAAVQTLFAATQRHLAWLTGQGTSAPSLGCGALSQDNASPAFASTTRAVLPDGSAHRRPAPETIVAAASRPVPFVLHDGELSPHFRGEFGLGEFARQGETVIVRVDGPPWPSGGAGARSTPLLTAGAAARPIMAAEASLTTVGAPPQTAPWTRRCRDCDNLVAPRQRLCAGCKIKACRTASRESKRYKRLYGVSRREREGSRNKKKL